MTQTQLHLHLLSDSTGETLENIAKAGLAQFDGVETIKHFWPMVRSEGHLDRVLVEIAQRPGLVIYTLVNAEVRRKLEMRCHALGLSAIAPLDGVTEALSRLLGQEAKARPGRQHSLDAAYFARVDAIQFTIAHDDGIGAEDWEEADIMLAGVSRSSKTPTAIYLANRGYSVANIPLVVESPPPPSLFTLKHPLVVGLTTSPDRLVQIRRNRLLSLNQVPETAYVDHRPAMVRE
jgi:regulator of PEP synthase PpsR (kinase-PPPase family)